MTVRTSVFTAQISRLRQEGYHFVSLTALIEGASGKTALPDKALAITVDDGHRSVYTELLPVILRERLPVTLFIYPSAISNASYALSWEQLREIMGTGLVDVHSHTYWHPNFRQERARLSPEKYREFVRMQLKKPRAVLKEKLGVEARSLAWPYGIHDAELEQAATSAGYEAAFALENRSFINTEALMAMPRYLIVDRNGADGLIRLLQHGEHDARGERP
ncbi:polysaccharide deacetylase family protein [Undibacterium sp. TS12]|uniref:polysaccharide deacetylase family protein n=1 Tax=Undibacterium sp. TS12 TaxID=2908202 RepID=UPI001F4C5E05|nr:polysaccharide deacetylase family protein [Undibacterium sp. TS12]MCH8622474.1 polysaccharide deacetylase family protein [Undibacterium sp. TS12]